ncbi:MAG: hypothetical protein K0Q73_8286 [Paenibacillus sp.]|jgi:hypothetical protein|nr:hypothetical protein [Paenibacillus sp.]
MAARLLMLDRQNTMGNDAQILLDLEESSGGLGLYVQSL